MRIALVDDHQLFRKGMAALLSTIENVLLVIEAGNGEEFLTALQTKPVDLVLLDLKMPVLGGVATLQILKEKYPDVRVIVLTMENGEETILQLMEAGANGFLAKDAHPDEVRLAIQSVEEKGFYANNHIAKIMMHGLSQWRSGSRNAGVELTERERTVLKGICQERSTQEIAEQLFLSPRTIEGYRRDLLEKLNVKSSIGLVVFASKNGWLEKWIHESDD